MPAAANRLPADLEFDAVGSWWNGSREIDAVAQVGRRTTLVGSCKWTNALVGLEEVLRLQRTAAEGADVLQPVESCWYAVFSREGFDPRLVEHARQRENRVLLVTLEDLFSV